MFILFLLFNLVIWSPLVLQFTYHQISVPMREENVCLRPLAVEVQIAASSRFLAVVSCFRAASISEQSNGNGNSQKGSRAYFHSNAMFLLLAVTRVVFHLFMILVKK